MSTHTNCLSVNRTKMSSTRQQQNKKRIRNLTKYVPVYKVGHFLNWTISYKLVVSQQRRDLMLETLLYELTNFLWYSLSRSLSTSQTVNKEKRCYKKKG